MPLDSQLVSVRLRSTLSGTAGLGTASVPLDITDSVTYTNGTAANQADKVWSAQYAIVGSATQSIDMAGVLVDALGTALSFAKIKTIYVKHVSGLNTLRIERPAANGAVLFGAASGALAVLTAGGRFLWDDPGAGFVVTAGTADLLSLVNTAATNTITVNIVLVGTSA
jgi:hypothetical protein